jgi:hypothetical protein
MKNLCDYCGVKLPAPVSYGCVVGIPRSCKKCQSPYKLPYKAQINKAQINKQMAKNIKDVLGLNLKFD